MGQQGSPAEREAYIKSSYLLNFVRYVEWPEEVFSSPKTPFVIGILGRNGLGSSPEKVILGQSIGGRSLVVRRFDTLDEASKCHMVFVGARERRHRDLLESLGEQPVLTVGEAEDFLEEGGGIRLVRTDNRVGFEVNLDSANRLGLRVSSRMLEIASRVFRGGEDGS